MKKLLYALVGAVIAAIPGYFVGCFCSCNDSTTSWAFACAFAIFGVIIGFICGWSADSEDKEMERKAYEERKRKEAADRQREEQRRKQAEEQRFKDWSDSLHLMYRKIEKNIGPDFDPQSTYTAIWKRHDDTSLDDRQKTEFERQLIAHRDFLHNEMNKCLLREMGIGGLAQSAFVADCLTIAEPDVQDNATVAKVLRDTLRLVIKPLCYISFSGYGDCEFPLDSKQEMERISEKADEQLEEFKKIETRLRESKKDIVQVALQFINPELIRKQCMLMWYYAKLKPFDVNRFENARFAFMTHTARYCRDPGVKDEMKAFSFGGEKMKVIALGMVEEVLARIYSKNQIGGVGTVRQEKDYIDFWLEQRIIAKDYDECYTLASGLAWMELYEFELDVLRKLVAADVQLPTELQERLSFLESGGTVNIKLYDIDSSNGFPFDNSSIDWKAKEFAVFFRKMAMKKTASSTLWQYQNGQKHCL